VVAGSIAGAGGGIEAHGAQPIKASTRTAAMAVGRRRHENAKGTRRTPGSRCVERGYRRPLSVTWAATRRARLAATAPRLHHGRGMSLPRRNRWRRWADARPLHSEGS
jgi:hypothetical protein